MAVKTATYAPTLGTDTYRGPSNAIWGTTHPREGALGLATNVFWDDFNDFPDYVLYNGERQLGQWDCWVGNNSGATIGTSADTTNLPLEGGVIGLYGGTTAIDVTMQAGVPGYRFVTSATGNAMQQGKIFFETRIAVSSVASAALDLFVGLMDSGWAGTHVTSAASLCFSSTNTLKTASGMGACLGFWKRATTNPTDLRVAYNVNNGTVQTPSSGVSATAGLGKIATNSGQSGYASGLTAMTSTSGVAAANTFFKVGFIYDPTPSAPTMIATEATTANQTAGTAYTARVQFFFNGQRMPQFLTTSDLQATTFPNTFLVPTIGYRSGGSSAGIAYVDWIGCSQGSIS